METTRLLEEHKRIYWGLSRKIPHLKESFRSTDQADTQIKKAEPGLAPEANRPDTTVNWQQLERFGEPNSNNPVSQEITAQAEGPQESSGLPDGAADQVSREIQRQSRRYTQNMEGWLYDEPSL